MNNEGDQDSRQSIFYSIPIRALFHRQGLRYQSSSTYVRSASPRPMLAEVFNDTVFYFLEGVGLRNVSKSTFGALEWCYEIVLWTLHYLPMLCLQPTACSSLQLLIIIISKSPLLPLADNAAYGKKCAQKFQPSEYLVFLSYVVW